MSHDWFDIDGDGKLDDFEQAGKYAYYAWLAEEAEKEEKNNEENYNSNLDGCYVATCVYGSYDCPEVWTLRRYRDLCLYKTTLGRAFIKIYYAISPTIVKWFGDTGAFKTFWKKRLDKMVEKLQSEGYQSTPYHDRIRRK